MSNKDIFERMHEKMTPSREAEEELFARAEAIARGESDPSAETETIGGIIMNRTIKDSTHETELNTVRTRRGGIIAAAAAIAVALGIGGYAAFGGGVLPMDEKTKAPAAASQPEEDKAETQPATGTVDAPSAGEGSGTMSMEEALSKASILLGVPADAIKVDSYYLLSDNGIESYEITCSYDDYTGVTITVPTGLKTGNDGTPDAFMTETAAGQALTDAGIKHDEFEVLSVQTIRPMRLKNMEYDETGCFIQFIANGERFTYFINDKSEIISKSSDGVHYDRIPDENTPSYASRYSAQIKAGDLLGVPFNELLITSMSLEEDHGVQSYEFECTVDGIDKTISVTVPTGKVTPDDEPDFYMTETGAGMALTEAGIAHEEFEALASYEYKGKDDKGNEHSGWKVIFIAKGAKYTYFIDDKGVFVEKEKESTGNARTDKEDTLADSGDLGITKELQEKYNEAEDIQSKGLEIVRIAGDAEDDITEWTAPADKNESAISDLLGEIKNAQDSYVPRKEWEGESDGTKETYMIINGLESFEFRVNKDGQTYIKPYNGNEQYILPAETWDSLLTLIKDSKPAFDLSAENTVTDPTGKEYISGKSAVEIVKKLRGGNIAGLAGTSADLDYALTGGAAWIVTLNIPSKDGDSVDVYTYLVNADKTDPYVIAADQRKFEM